ncbi:MAG: CpaF family protein, partial [Allobranchiibius sp.]
MDGVTIVEDEVRELIRRQRLDPMTEHVLLRGLVSDVIKDYEQRSLHGGMAPLGDVETATRAVLNSVAGYGPLQPYLDDPTVEEIWINDPARVFVARSGIAELTSTILTQ